LFSSTTASVFVKKAVEKELQTQLQLPGKTMNYTRITLHNDHLKAGFAQEEIFFFRTSFFFA
jgi:hypothetical protein